MEKEFLDLLDLKIKENEKHINSATKLKHDFENGNLNVNSDKWKKTYAIK